VEYEVILRRNPAVEERDSASISLLRRARPRGAARSRDWIAKLAGAIRKRDPKRLITIGLVDWSLDRPGLTSGLVPKEIAP